jgi:cellulose synthase/poly-beta-1,6-N-acetylglucosamine synthase-like glycosyltransferase
MTQNDEHSISIVICTHERHVFIKKTIESLCQINYPNFEVIVVDSSETELTLNSLELMKNSCNFPLLIIRSKQRNISISRNIGINNASGEFIFFIDDDAIPPADWLDKLLAIYRDRGDNCAGVGGIVRDMTTDGCPLQYCRGISNIISNTIPIRSDKAINYNRSQGWWYNGLMGANSSYRKDHLKKVNGYDEFFDYFLDETDLCLRLIQAGYEIYYSDVIVDHYPQPSHNRQDRKHLTCWFSIAKNTTYFALKHAFNKMPFPIFCTRLIILLNYRCFLRIIRLKFTHNISFQLIWQYIHESLDGVYLGWKSGIKLYTHNIECRD